MGDLLPDFKATSSDSRGLWDQNGLINLPLLTLLSLSIFLQSTANDPTAHVFERRYETQDGGDEGTARPSG